MLSSYDGGSAILDNLVKMSTRMCDYQQSIKERYAAAPTLDKRLAITNKDRWNDSEVTNSLTCETTFQQEAMTVTSATRETSALGFHRSQWRCRRDELWMFVALFAIQPPDPTFPAHHLIRIESLKIG